jgi:hypothetical protein
MRRTNREKLILLIIMNSLSLALVSDCDLLFWNPINININKYYLGVKLRNRRRTQNVLLCCVIFNSISYTHYYSRNFFDWVSIWYIKHIIYFIEFIILDKFWKFFSSKTLIISECRRCRGVAPPGKFFRKISKEKMPPRSVMS